MTESLAYLSRPRPDGIHLVLLPDAHLLDLAAPAQILGHTSLQTELQWLSARPSQRSAQGLVLSNLIPLPNSVPDNHWLIICGSRKAQHHLSDPIFLETVDWLRRTAEQYVFWAGVCSGSLLAACAGMLDDKPCTTHHDLVAELRSRAPRADVRDDCLFVEAERCMTSAGIATGLDMSLHLVALHWGHDVAARIARETVLYHRRHGDESQASFWLEHRNHLNSRVHRVQDLIMARPGDHWTTDTLAASVHISERHLRRLFREITGIRLSDYLVDARLCLARQLLRDTRLPMQAIAERCGFGSERSLRRHWTRRETVTPSVWRGA